VEYSTLPQGCILVAMEPRMDLEDLREQFPGWRIGSVWATAATGPDARRLWATRDGVTVTAWTAIELSQEIRREEQAS
jgi:hypothetical protein